MIIYKFGADWIDVVLPPAAMGPVVALIGLELAGSAAGTAGLIATAGAPVDMKNVVVFAKVFEVRCDVTKYTWKGMSSPDVSHGNHFEYRYNS